MSASTQRASRVSKKLVPLALSLLGLVATDRARADASLTAVATSGQAAPGVAGAVLTRIGSSNVAGNGADLYHLTGAGKLAFAAGVMKDGGYATGVWVRDGDALALALEPDFGSQDENRCVYVIEGPFPLASGKLVVLCSRSNEGGVAAASLFYGLPGALELKTPPGTVAPGATERSTFFRMGNLRVREPGVVAFESSLDSASVDLGKAGTGIWLWTPTSLQLVLQKGSPAPGATAQYVESLKLNALTASGKVLLSGARTGNSNRNAFWFGSNSADVMLAAAEGDATALQDETLYVGAPFVPSNYLTDADVLLTVSRGRSNGTQSALWVGRPGRALAPLNASDGSRLDPKLIDVSNAGRVAVSARATNSSRLSDEGLWAGTTEQIKLIARYGDPLRGMEAYKLKEVRSLQVNDQGHIILHAVLDGGGKSGDERLVRYAPARGFELVVTLDAVIDDHGTARAISAYTDACDVQRSLANRHRHCLDDEGRFAFLVTYSDRSQGLVVTDALPSGGQDIGVERILGAADAGQGSASPISGAMDAGAAIGQAQAGASADAAVANGGHSDAGTSEPLTPAASSSDDDGCSVRAPGAPRGSLMWLVLGVGALGATRRRRTRYAGKP